MNSTALRTLSLDRVRADFPILGTRVNGKPLVYLDNGATSQKPLPVIESQEAFYRTSNANVHRGVHQLSQESTRLYDQARSKIRVLLNAKKDLEVIFTAGCTAAINLVAESWGRANLKPGDEILISVMEHHSNIVPWQLIAGQTGAKVRVIPMFDNGEIDIEAFGKLLSEQTKLVAITHVSNALGTINPIRQMISAAHAVGAKVMVDGAQGGPHLRIDVQELDADFYALSCHKMYAPTGVGVLYGKEDLLEAMPPYQGGGDMIQTVSFDVSTYADLPFKFEAGTPNIAGVVGLGATVDYLGSLGAELLADDLAPLSVRLDACFDWIGRHEASLTEYGMKSLSEIEGVTMTGTAAKKAGILAFTLDCAHPHDIGTILDSEGIAVRSGHHCCMPLMKRLGVPATVRASLALYNKQSEIDSLVSGVLKVREMFG